MATVQWAAGPSGQGSVQVLEFLFAFLLSGLIGVERQIRQKSAGLRTYTTVGSGAALFTLVSKYGFADVVSAGTVELDPSRMAAQIVSGLGFIGAGVIFVHRGWVQGLTTAATIWLTAAVGSAAAAGLPLLAALTVAAYFLASYAIRPLLNRLPALHRPAVSYRIVYRPGRGVLRDVLDQCTRAGFAVFELRTLSGTDGELPGEATDKPVEIALSVQGQGDAGGLTAQIAAVAGVLTCVRGRSDEE